jgi:GR25 family glycosyltransferase involved in LPS biosynthesis
MPYDFVTGVDGRLLDISDPLVVDQSAVADGSLARGNAVAAAVGCSLSHSRTYRTILETGASASLILEDDSRLPSDPAELVEAVASHIPAGAYVALLSFAAIGTDYTGPLRAFRTGITLPGHRELLEIADLEHTRLTTAYLITQDACQHMLAFTTPVRAAADDWNYFVQHGAIQKVYCVSPMPIWPDHRFRSTMDFFHPQSIQAQLRNLATHTPGIAQVLSLRRHNTLRRFGVTGEVEILNVPFQL